MSRISYFLFLVVILGCFLFPQNAQAQTGLNLACIQQYYHDWIDGSYDVAVANGYAFLACGQEGVHVLDISDLDNIRDVARIADIHATAVAVQNHNLYLGINNEGIYSFDVSDPIRPREKEFVRMPDCTFNTLRIQGDYLCVGAISAAGKGLSFIKIGHDETFEPEWSSATIAIASDIEIRNHRAYVGVDDKLLVLDVTNMSSPQAVDSIAFSSWEQILGVTIYGDYGCLAAGDGGFIIVDLASHEIVSRITDLDPLVPTDIDYPIAVRIVDSLAYVHYNIYDCPLAVINIADPMNPVVLSNYYPPDNISKFVIANHAAYIADLTSGLRVVNVRDPYHLAETHGYDDCEQDLQIAGMNGDMLYIQQRDRLLAVDVSDPRQPRERAAYRWVDPDPPLYWRHPMILQTEIIGIVGYMLCGDEYWSKRYLYSLDLSDPDRIAILDSLELKEGRGFIYADSRISIQEENCFQIVNVSDPRHLYLAEKTSNDFSNISILEDGYILKSHSDGFYICSHEHLDDPQWIGPFDRQGLSWSVQHGQIVDGMFYAASYRNFAIYSISDTRQLSVTTIPNPDGSPDFWISDLKVVDRIAYISLRGRGIEIWDIGDPQSVARIGYDESSSLANGLTVQGSLIYVAAETHLGIYNNLIPNAADPARDMTPQSCELYPNFPNPFNATTTIAFDLPNSGDVSLTVFNTIGQQVATLADGSFMAGHHQIQWNGCSSSGTSLASGMYFYRLQTGKAVINRQMILLR